MKLLIIDDHPIVRSGIETLIRQNDSDLIIAQAANAEDAMRMLDEQADFKVAILDLQMPGMSGLDAISTISGKCPELKIIVLSMSDSPHDVRSAFARGARGYVPKSAGPNTLLLAIRIVTNGERYVPPLILEEQPVPFRSGPRSPPRDAVDLPLTRRQIEVLRYLTDGAPNKVIANRLGLSEKTVKAHVSAIFKALNVLNRTQAATAARDAGIL
ncbi:response regulator [Burkholderia theae]|uniref:response regulator n=1 Tax=Burkholderia theae TaxID=3143496 RepID=UPI003AFA04B8